MCNHKITLLAISAFVFTVHFGNSSFAHEGHRPLPTRGIEVDAEKGTLLLTRSARQTLDLQTGELTQQSITSTITTYGSLIAPWNQHAFVTSPIAGRINKLNFVAGDKVRKGQVLAELECPALEQLQMELRSSKIDLELNERLIQSIAEASRSGAIPGMRLIEAQSKLQQAQAALKIASAKWESLRLPYEGLERILQAPQSEHQQLLSLKSPIDGVITHTDLSIGKNVSEKEHLLEVIDLSSVWLKISVLEKDIANVRVGQKVELQLTSSPQARILGVIDVIDRYLDPQTHLATAWATLQNEPSSLPSLLPGMSGRVQIQSTASEPQLVLPVEAVIRDGAERFVLVEQERSLNWSSYRKLSVVFGQRSGHMIEVRGGSLFPGDRVVTQGSHELGAFFAKGVLAVSQETASDIGLVVASVAVREIAKTVSIDGVIDLLPTHRAVASARLSGAIDCILADRGKVVRRGEVIAEINSQEFQDLQLQFLRTELEAKLQQTIVDNLRVARSGVSERQLLEAESQLSQTRAQRDAASRRLQFVGLSNVQLAALASSQKLLSTLPVTAPIDGVIVGFDKFLGHVVQPEEPMFEIHDLSKAAVQGFVAERDLPKIQLGQSSRCRLVTSPNEVLSGKVVRSGQQVSANDRTLSVWVELNAMPSFPIQHNMLARLTIDCGIVTSGRAVPRDAVIQEGSRSYVFVRKADQTFERRLIIVGPADDTAIAVVDGLRDGEMVAVRGAAELQSGYAALK